MNSQITFFFLNRLDSIGDRCNRIRTKLRMPFNALNIFEINGKKT